MRTSVVTSEPRGSVRGSPPPGLLTAGGSRTPLLCLAILFVDQASKAMQPAGRFVVNTGGPAILPSAVGDALWRSQTFGAVCDSIDAVLLVAGLGLVSRLTRRSRRTAATAVVAGLLSNLVDRLGAASLFHVGLPRGSIDWIPVPAWPIARTNIADIVITVGVLALLCDPVRRSIRATRALALRGRATRLAVAAIGVVAIATWTGVWQANRHTAEFSATKRSEASSTCSAIDYSSDGMDWVSYRPAAGPLPYRPTCPAGAHIGRSSGHEPRSRTKPIRVTRAPSSAAESPDKDPCAENPRGQE